MPQDIDAYNLPYILFVIGDISNAMLLNAMPFGNDIVAVTVSGKTLKEVFENSITAYDDAGKSGRFLQMSGKQ